MLILSSTSLYSSLLQANFQFCENLGWSTPLFTQARAFQLHPSHFRGVAKAALYCAHRTSTFLSCAFCEQEGHLAAPLPLTATPTKSFQLSSSPSPTRGGMEGGDLRCARRTRAFRFLMSFLEGGAEAALYCAHRTSTFLSCAFCEHEGHLAAPSSFF